MKAIKNLYDKITNNEDNTIAPPQPPTNPQQTIPQAPPTPTTPTSNNPVPATPETTANTTTPQQENPISDEARIKALQQLVEQMRAEEQNTHNPPPPFHLADGTVIRGPSDLAEACKTMSEEVFTHHVNETRNDFAQWVNDAYHDAALAEKLLDAKTPTDVTNAIINKEPLPDLPELQDQQAFITQQEVYKAEISALREEIASLHQALSTEIISSLEQLRAETQEQQQALDTQQETLRATQAQVQEQQATNAARAEQLATREATITQQEQALREQQSNLEAREAKLREEVDALSQAQTPSTDTMNEREQALTEREHKLDKKESSLNEREEAVKRREEHANNLLAQSREAEQALQQKREELLRAEEALATHKAQLASTRSQLDALEQTLRAKNPTPAPITNEQPSQEYNLLSRINTARQYLAAGRVAEAKNLYAEIRTQFYNTTMSDDDKKQVYNLIRELYADIELAIVH